MIDDNIARYYNEEIYRFPGRYGTPLSDVSAGYTFYDPTYNFEVRNSMCYCFSYIYKGEFIQMHGENTYKTCAGDLIINHANVYRRFFAPKDENCKKVWILVPCRNKYIKHLIQDYNLENTVLLKGYNDSKRIENCINLIKNKAPQRTLEFQIHALISDIADFVYSGKPSIQSIAENAKLYLDSHLQCRLKMETLYAHLGLCKTQAIKIFTDYYSITPKTYFINEKIEASKKLLLETKTPISQIAATFAFNDLYHYSNTFKKKVGLSPAQYRKMHTYPL